MAITSRPRISPASCASASAQAPPSKKGKFGQFDVFLDGDLVASKGGFWKRKLKHGAPPPAKVLATIERAIADREGAFCKLPESS